MSNEEIRHLTFKGYLEAQLNKRCEKNPYYSLRAFAQFLDIDHSTLSQMIRGKRKITPAMQQRLGSKLGLGPKELKQFDPTLNYSEVMLDLFEITSEWYYFAIMELMVVNDFRPDPKWISERLGVEIGEIKSAILRLVNAGFISIDSDGNWVDTSAKNVTTLDHNLTSPAHIKMQTQLLDKAADAMGKYGLEKRSQTGMTMAIDRSKLPKAKEMIIKFQRELCAFLEDGDQNDVYHLGISLFPMTDGDE